MPPFGVVFFYGLIMGLIAAGQGQAAVNSPPEWTGVPNPQWDAGVGGTYGLAQHVFDADADSLAYTLNAGSAALPANVTLAGATGIFTATSSVTEATTTGIIIDIDDSVNAKVASSSFSITVNAAGESPIQDVLFVHDHDTEAEGINVPGVSGLFGESTDTNSYEPTYAKWDIITASSDPIYTGKKKFLTYMEQIIVDGNAQVYRTERSASGADAQRIDMTDAGGGDWYAPEKLWYGWIMRVDRMDIWGVKSPLSPYNDAEGFKGGGVLQQWHMRNWDPPTDRNPNLSLVHQLGGLYVRLEANLDNSGQDKFSDAVLDETIAGTSGGSYEDGETHAFIWEVLWDSRTTANGSTGIIRLYIDDSATAAFEWGTEGTGKSNMYPEPHLDTQSPPRTPYTKHGGYRRDFDFWTVSLPNGTAEQFSWGNIVMHGSSANRQGVLESLNWTGIA